MPYSRHNPAILACLFSAFFTNAIFKVIVRCSIHGAIRPVWTCQRCPDTAPILLTDADLLAIHVLLAQLAFDVLDLQFHAAQQRLFRHAGSGRFCQLLQGQLARPLGLGHS